MEQVINDEIMEKIRERIIDLEVENILQKDLLELLSTTPFQGEQMQEAAARIDVLRMQISFNEDYLNKLHDKYEVID